jgi:hypothetical protein
LCKKCVKSIQNQPFSSFSPQNKKHPQTLIYQHL